MATPHAFLIEDNPTIRDNLIPTLAEIAGVEVVGTAEGQREAMTWLRSHDGAADFVILDLFLAEGSGIGVLEQLGAMGNELPVVVLTNYATPDIRRRCLALGAAALFDKSREIEAFFDYCERGLPQSQLPH